MKRSFALLPAVLCLALFAWTDRADAQHFSFSLGHGHGHHHHHCWDPFWYRPHWDFYYAPPPRVTYVQPERTVIVQQQAAAAPTTSNSLASIPSTTNTSNGIAATTVKNSLPAYRGSGVTLHNRSSVGLAVSCVVDGQMEVHLRPGESRTLREKASYIVEFDRGGNFGAAKYELSEGEYQFGVSDRGWDITRDEISQTATRPAIKPNTLPATIR